MIKLCIVGAGRMPVEHLKVFSEIKNIELSGISTRTKKKRHSKKTGADKNFCMY